MPRQSEGLTHGVRVRATADEAQMVKDIGAQLGMSQNRAARWAIRFAWQHATSTTEHDSCTAHSPCAGATRGLSSDGRQHATPVPEGQQQITHEAAVEKR